MDRVDGWELAWLIMIFLFLVGIFAQNIEVLISVGLGMMWTHLGLDKVRDAI